MGTRSDVSVVICAYTTARWDMLVAAVASVQQQSLPANEIIVVVDHNEALLQLARTEFPGARVAESEEQQGLSGARNTGVRLAQGAIIAFLDDDAVAEPDWLQRLTDAYSADDVLGVGGAVNPVWCGGRPAWFPREFDWVVGCSYRGMPTTTTAVQRFTGANMSFRREVFEALGGFRSELGRLGRHPLASEETEVCIRVCQHWAPTPVLRYEPLALVHHHVPRDRATVAYFRSRCYAEGLSQAAVSRHVGVSDGLAAEREYTTRVLPRALLGAVADAVVHHNVRGLSRAGAILGGLSITTLGYLVGMVATIRPKALPQARRAIRVREGEP